jgi:hypothetical protein
MAKAENRAPGGSRDAAGNVDPAEGGSNSNIRLGMPEKLGFRWPAFARVPDGCLTLNCPALGGRRYVSCDCRKIRVDGPAGRHLPRAQRWRRALIVDDDLGRWVHTQPQVDVKAIVRGGSHD